MRIGVLSDTHGLLRPRVLELLEGSEHILHAGDVGDGHDEQLAALADLAPVTAIRGNVDPPGTPLPPEVHDRLGDLPFLLAHRREDVLARLPNLDPAPRLAVFGHSHRPEIEWRGSTLLLNPGACGPRRFHLPLTVARLTVDGERLTPEILAVE